jgi:hypothetical protein
MKASKTRICWPLCHEENERIGEGNKETTSQQKERRQQKKESVSERGIRTLHPA